MDGVVAWRAGETTCVVALKSKACDHGQIGSVTTAIKFVGQTVTRGRLIVTGGHL